MYNTVQNHVYANKIRCKLVRNVCRLLNPGVMILSQTSMKPNRTIWISSTVRINTWLQWKKINLLEKKVESEELKQHQLEYGRRDQLETSGILKVANKKLHWPGPQNLPTVINRN